MFVQRGLRRGILNLIREGGWGMSLLELTGVVLLVQMAVILSIAAVRADGLLRAETAVTVELGNPSDSGIQQLIIALRDLPYVTGVEFITREKALELARRQSPAFIESMESARMSNPYADSITVTLSALSARDTLRQFLVQPQWARIISPVFFAQRSDQEAQTSRMLSLVNTGRRAALSFLLFTVFALLLTISSLARKLSDSRSEDLCVARLSGAEETSILLPFVTEISMLLFGALILGTAVIVPVFFLIPSASMLIPAVESVFTTRVSVVLLLEALAVPLIGGLGVWIGVRMPVR